MRTLATIRWKKISSNTRHSFFMPNKLARALLLTSALLLSACSLVSADVEQAPYKTLLREQNIEIRHYQDIVLVSANMASNERSNGAFMKLFRYISGRNENEQKIPMTAPVFMDPKRQEKMSFVLPGEYRITTAPKPSHKDLNLEHWQERFFATIRFNGRLNQKNIAVHSAQLEQWLIDNNIEITGPAIMAGYDDPMTLPAWRRNEVLIPVSYQPAS